MSLCENVICDDPEPADDPSPPAENSSSPAEASPTEDAKPADESTPADDPKPVNDQMETLIIPDKPVDININVNVNELMVEYNQLIAQVLNNQRNIASKIDNIAREFDSARERVIRRIIEENTKYMNIIRESRRIRIEDKDKLITQLQTAVSTAMNEVQTLGMTTQNEIRSNNMKSNSEDTSKITNLVKELQTSQGNAIESVMKSVADVPAKMNSHWGAVEAVTKEIDSKNK